MKKKTLDKTLMSGLYGLVGLLIWAVGWMISMCLFLVLVAAPLEIFTNADFDVVRGILTIVSLVPGAGLAALFLGFARARKRFDMELDPAPVGDDIAKQIGLLEFWIGFAKVREVPIEVVDRFRDLDEYKDYVEENAHSLATVIRNRYGHNEKWYLCYMAKSDELNLLLRS